MVSICVPAYKKPEFVVRLLESVLQQTYRDVELVITDDSPDDAVKLAIEPYTSQLNIQYYHNTPALGSPRNWNSAIERSGGDYYLLLHQDDWFHDPNAIQLFLEAFQTDSQVGFVFCKNTAMQPDGQFIVLQAIPALPYQLKKHPNWLALAQVMGPPSNVMLRKDVKGKVSYDERFIWFVDVDYNTRLIKNGYDYVYLDKHLVTIGLHKDQTTEYCGENLDIKFKENIWFAGKLEPGAFKDMRLYDYYWRLLRNFNIRSLDDFYRNKLNRDDMIPVLMHMFKWQKRIPLAWLKMGILSKLIMTLNFITNPFK